MTSHAPDKLTLFQYAFLALPLSFAGLPLYIHIPDFYTRDMGMNIGVMGGILLFIRLFDAIQDPVIGYISDHKPQARFTFMGIGLAILTAGLAGLFYGPQLLLHPAIWFSVFMILATTGFSIVSINLNMIGGFWRDNNNERVNISAWREAFGLGGLLLAAIAPTLLQNSTSPETSFIILFWIFACLLLLASTLLFRIKSNFDHAISETNTSSQSRFSFLKILIGPDRQFFAICFLSQLAAALPAVLVLFYIRDYLMAEDYTGLFLIAYFLSGAAFIGIWVKLSEYTGMYKTWLISTVLAVITFIGAYILQPGDIIAYGIICALSGIALGADLTLPPAIIADRIERQKTKSEATQYYALLAFIPKISVALAAGFSFLALDQFGFQAGEDNNSEALHTLVIAYALIPCIIKIFAAGLLWHLILKEGHHNEKNERNITHGTARNS